MVAKLFWHSWGKWGRFCVLSEEVAKLLQKNIAKIAKLPIIVMDDKHYFIILLE